MVKLRLSRHGKKGKPFYHIVAADARAPRDGKFIEKVGTYNPNTNPATINLNFDKALDWLGKGAQPTDTCRAILSYKGVLYKNHLNKGVAKGALSQADADKKFEAWLADKNNKVQSVTDKIAADAKADIEARMAAEREINETRAKEIAAKNSPVVEEEVVEETAAEATEEAPAAEAAEETPAEEKTEE